MTSYKTVIIEDNPDNADVLKKILKKNHPDIKIVAEANTVASAKEVLLKYQPDIALMDIELTPGTSFDVLMELNALNAINFEIIFITAHQRYDYVTKAIDFSSLAFLNKPIDPDILRGAIEKAKDKQTKKVQIEQLFDKLNDLSNTHTRIVIPTANNNRVVVQVSDIVYFEADGQTTIIHLQDGSILKAFRILGHFKKMLLGEYDFFLIHHSILLNVNQVQSFKYLSLEITLKTGEVLTASRRFGKDFKKYWDDFNNKDFSFWQNIKRLLN